MSIKSFLSQNLNGFLFGTVKRKSIYYLLAVFFILATAATAYIYKQTDDLSFLSPREIVSVLKNAPQTGTTGSSTETAGSNNTVAGSDSQQKNPKNNISASSSSSNSTSQQGNSSEPVTPPSNNPPENESPSATIAFYADTQTDTQGEEENHESVVHNILATGANPIFHAGDLMEDGTQTSLDYFNAATATLRATRTFYATLGNNDRKIGDSSTPSPLFLANFIFPGNEQWYSVNTGNLHIVILDSAFSSASQSQRDWLISDLQSAASQQKITGVMYHHPDFASSISSILRDNGVDFVVSGHIHSYSHTITDNIHYFTMTGQPSIGYFIANIYSNSAIIKAYNSSNALIDTISFDER